MKYEKHMLIQGRITTLGLTSVSKPLKTRDLNSSYLNIQLTLLLPFLILFSNAVFWEKQKQTERNHVRDAYKILEKKKIVKTHRKYFITKDMKL